MQRFTGTCSSIPLTERFFMIRCDMRTVNRSGLRKFPVLRDLFHVGTNVSRIPDRGSLCRSLRVARHSLVATKLLVARGFHAHTWKCPGVSGAVNDDKHATRTPVFAYAVPGSRLA
jgi:hypothetical protein